MKFLPVVSNTLAVCALLVTFAATAPAALVNTAGLCMQLHTSNGPGIDTPQTSNVIEAYKWEGKKWVLVSDSRINTPTNKPIVCMNVGSPNDEKKRPALMIAYETNDAPKCDWTRIGWTFANDPNSGIEVLENEEVRALFDGTAVRTVDSEAKGANFPEPNQITLVPRDRTNYDGVYGNNVVATATGLCVEVFTSENQPAAIQSYKWNGKRWVMFADNIHYPSVPQGQSINQVSWEKVVTCLNEAGSNGKEDGYITMVYSRDSNTNNACDGTNNSWRRAGWAFANDPCSHRN